MRWWMTTPCGPTCGTTRSRANSARDRAHSITITRTVNTKKLNNNVVVMSG